ncbi:MAG: hypothetical protein IIY33_05500 [Erysipelotrichaceae bacterium]|nr:hypothetical protein [Erysipelotrichaceae bacterium]
MNTDTVFETALNNLLTIEDESELYEEFIHTILVLKYRSDITPIQRSIKWYHRLGHLLNPLYDKVSKSYITEKEYNQELLLLLISQPEYKDKLDCLKELVVNPYVPHFSVELTKSRLHKSLKTFPEVSDQVFLEKLHSAFFVNPSELILTLLNLEKSPSAQIAILRDSLNTYWDIKSGKKNALIHYSHEHENNLSEIFNRSVNSSQPFDIRSHVSDLKLKLSENTIMTIEHVIKYPASLEYKAAYLIKLINGYNSMDMQKAVLDTALLVAEEKHKRVHKSILKT